MGTKEQRKYNLQVYLTCQIEYVTKTTVSGGYGILLTARSTVYVTANHDFDSKVKEGNPI